MKLKMMTEKQEAKTRHNTCKSCNKYRKMLDQCSICGCIMTLKTKLTNATCPEGRWGNNSWDI